MKICSYPGWSWLARPFADLTRNGLWRFGTERLSVFFDDVSTDRDPAYEGSSDSKAAASDSFAGRGEFGLRADCLKVG